MAEIQFSTAETPWPSTFRSALIRAPQGLQKRISKKVTRRFAASVQLAARDPPRRLSPTGGKKAAKLSLHLGRAGHGLGDVLAQ